MKDPAQRWRVGPALSGTWTSLPGGIEPNGSTGGFMNRLEAGMRFATPLPAGGANSGATVWGFNGQIAPLRVLHENAQGETLSVDQLPVTVIGVPQPAGAAP
jgi:hypothetical protein